MEKAMIKPNMDSLKRNAKHFEIEYDEKFDTLYARLKNPPTAISYDCGGEFWLRINPQNGEVVGFEIEAYRKSFVKKFKDLKNEKLIKSQFNATKISNELAGCLS